jgi:predicted  nucleic acid-binding Zn-ribbon protein
MRQLTVSNLALLVAVLATEAVSEAVTTQANPVRKVVTLLQSMQKKVEAEGKKEKELYEKFMCYCNGGSDELKATIQAADEKVPAVSSDIEATEGKISQLKSGLSEAQKGRDAAKAAMAEAKALREKEATSFAGEKSDYDANIAAIEKAVGALEKGMGGSFLQTSTAATLRKLAMGMDMQDMDRQDLTAFLSGKQAGGYAPQSGQITGILKQMGDTMKKSLSDATSAEEASIKAFDELMSAKSKEVEALTASIEAKTTQIGESGVALVQMKEDLSDTQETLLEDKKFLQGLEKSCKTKTAEWEERSKTRSEELLALADTIKILNDDDALELFKKTLPSAGSSFVQVKVSAYMQRQQALALIRQAQKATNHGRPGLDLLALSLSGQKALAKGTFDKVIKMIDEMVDVLGAEQQGDDHKKEYCEKEFDTADDKKKSLERKVSDEDSAIAAAKDGIAELTDEIAALEKGIKDLDKSVAEATSQRKEEHADFKDLMASDSAAKELLGIAKNRLNKFYNPKLHKPAAKRELDAEGRIYENMGGEIATTTPGGIAGTGVTVLAQVRAHDQRSGAAPAPPPETWGAYEKKSGESTGVISMIDLLIKDLDKELTEAETSEKDAQADYETMMSDSASKRTADSKS